MALSGSPQIMQYKFFSIPANNPEDAEVNLNHPNHVHGIINVGVGLAPPKLASPEVKVVPHDVMDMPFI